MKKNVFLLAILNLFLYINLYANELEFNTLKSNFIQSVTSEKKTINYEGNFIITKNRAYWHYKKPTKKDIFIINNKVTIIEPDLEQAIYTNLKNTPNLNEILGRAKEVNNHFETIYDGIKYFIFLKNSLPYQIQYNDKIDNKVVLTFINPIKNSQVNQEFLTPKIPKNYDIITQ